MSPSNPLHRFPRIRPYKTDVIAADGSSWLLRAHEIALERPLSPALTVNLAPHPVFRSWVPLACFSTHSLILEPASGDILYAFLEERSVEDSRRKANRSRARPTVGHVYAVNADGLKAQILASRFRIHLSADKALDLNLAPAKPWAQHVQVAAIGGPLSVQLNAGNAVLLGVAH